MGYSIDVNLLLYASNTSSLHHDKARAFLEGCGRRPETLYLTWPILMGYLRIATSPAIFPAPLPPATAMDNVEALLRLPHALVLAERDGFWDLYRQVARDIVPRAKLVPDVHLAVLLRQHEVRTFYTHDADFRRFDFLDVVDPLA